MIKITKLMGMLLTAGLLLPLFGCSSDTPSAPEPAPSAAASTETPQEPVKTAEPAADPGEPDDSSAGVILYQGHASLRITTPEGKVIYVDPYAGEGYDMPADLILVTHQHDDHNKISKVAEQNPDCAVITNKEAVIDGEHQKFELDYVTVEPVTAANELHDPERDCGYILTFSDGVQVYISGDTDKTEQMEAFAERGLDYAFLCADGVFNMGPDEASECAGLIGARHSIPYHLEWGELYNDELAAQFDAPGKLAVWPGEELVLRGK